MPEFLMYKTRGSLARVLRIAYPFGVLSIPSSEIPWTRFWTQSHEALECVLVLRTCGGVSENRTA